jgi:hypothetical protein
MSVSYTWQVTIATGNVSVTGVGNAGGFFLDAGTLRLLNNAQLTIGSTAIADIWDGGTIAGNGTIWVQNTTLSIRGSASSISVDLDIGVATDQTAPFTSKVVVETAGNLTLAGPGNQIRIYSGGELDLLDNVSASETDLMGGITGGANGAVDVYTNGKLVRGDSGVAKTGQILISVPVEMYGGQLYVWSGGASRDVLHLSGQDSSGYSYDDNQNDDTIGSTMWVVGNAEVLADNGIFQDVASSAIYLRPDITGSGVPVLASDNVNIQAGTFGHQDPNQAPCLIEVDGNLTLGAAANLFLYWNANTADLLLVTGNVNLAGTLQMSGGTPPAVGQPVGFLDVYGDVSGDFSAAQWVQQPTATLQIGTLEDGNGGLLFTVQRQ